MRTRHPDEVVMADSIDAGTGPDMPAGEPQDDFFSSWDKPAIKKPTPPISRTATPPIVGRTPSPFPNVNGNGKDIVRAASPLAKSDSTDAKPAASRVTTSAALRKTAPASAGAGPRKASVFGAKKRQKLGVKKIAADTIDFDAAEKNAKEEAERIEKLGYDPNAEDEAAATIKKDGKSEGNSGTILAPTPVSASRAEKSASEMERLGMGLGRLGFGQVGSVNKAAAAKKSAGGFGSVGPIKATPEGTYGQGQAVLWRHELAKMRLTDQLPHRGRREVRTQQVRQPKGHFFGRVLRQGHLRP